METTPHILTLEKLIRQEHRWQETARKLRMAAGREDDNEKRNVLMRRSEAIIHYCDDIQYIVGLAFRMIPSEEVAEARRIAREGVEVAEARKHEGWE